MQMMRLGCRAREVMNGTKDGTRLYSEPSVSMKISIGWHTIVAQQGKHRTV